MLIGPLIFVLLGLASPARSENFCDNGVQQSPINIEINATEYSGDLNFETKIPKSKFSIDTNNSLIYTLHIELEDVEFPRIDWIRQSGNSQYYDLNHLEFHWNSDDSVGSEHSIDNKFGAAELRVHYYDIHRADYESALGEDYGVLIQTYILKLGHKLDLADLFKFNSMEKSGNVELDLSEIVSITRDSKFLKYEGTLSTCSIIQWLVMMDTVEITAEQLDKLRSLNSTGGHVKYPYPTNTDLKILRNYNIQESGGYLLASIPFSTLALTCLIVCSLFV